MKPVREGNVVTLPRQDGKTVDVFTGKGWDNHTVFEVHEKGVKLIKGKAMSAEDFKTFKGRL
jgi:hypothetical protein